MTPSNHYLHLVLTFICCCIPITSQATEKQPLRIATFKADVTPPIGAPLCLGLVQPVKKVVDPLSARGIVLLTDQKPIVLCAVDWVLINNGTHDAWVQALAKAANTTPERVSVHSLHQHDAPGVDHTAEELLTQVSMGGMMFDHKSAREAMEKTAKAIVTSIQHPQKVSHIGFGIGKVEKVASNRRLLGDDGKVAIVRFSSTRNPKAIKAPEGVIDPFVKLVSFWDGDRPLVSITHYATHPQSYYGKGGVSADFVGMARSQREQELPHVMHIHFNGAGGNIAAGKYNNGSKPVRPILAKRLATGMKAAWDTVKREPVTAADVNWSSKKVTLPLRKTLVADVLTKKLKNIQENKRNRMRAARDLAYVLRLNAAHQINIGCLKLNNARLLYLPGELFVEYQLAAARMLPKNFVAMAAYGDGGPGYIGTKIAYTQGGYETGKVSRTAPEVEKVLMETMKELLGVE